MSMKDWFKKRSGERSTFFGIGILAGAIGVLVKSPELQQAGEAIASNADNFVNFEQAWPVLLVSLLSVFAPTSK